jgi:rare lipoprotein A
LPWFSFALARHRAAIGLVVAGSIALIGAQQVLGTVADAQTTEAIVESPNFEPLNPTQTLGAPALVNAAVSTGQFEAPVIPTATPAPTQAPTVVPTPSPTPAPEPRLVDTGIASTYGEGDGFEGARTACGQIFHTLAVQIAHKSLPCGTLVRVVDKATGNSVDAPVTDRGPYVAGRVVDLSWAAFRQLEPAGPGLLRVDVYVVDE